MVQVRVPQARLWWPRGHGEQPLYDVALRLHDGRAALDEWHGRVGFRTVTLDTAPDPDGTAFTLLVNGRSVFARGVNWIPGDCFPSRVGRDRYAERLGRVPGQREPGADLGRRPLRKRRLLRHLRRAGPAGVAGLRVRLRRLRRGGAAARRGGGRGARAGDPAQPASQSGAVERRQ